MAGCISETGSGGACADGVGLDDAFGVAVSPDGASVYVASGFSDAVAVLDRAGDGTLTQKAAMAGCISETGSGGACVDGVGLNFAIGGAVSPDGASVYVASIDSDAVAVFDRAGDGTLTQKAAMAGCISETGSGGACADGEGLDGASGVAVSPDGASVYVASGFSDAVAVLDRAGDGTLTQKALAAGCISETRGGACADGVGLDAAAGVAVSPDGTSVYVASEFSDAVAVFDRAGDGTLTQKAPMAGCISETGSGGVCADGVGLDGATAVAASPDGTSVSRGVVHQQRRGGVRPRAGAARWRTATSASASASTSTSGRHRSAGHHDHLGPRPHVGGHGRYDDQAWTSGQVGAAGYPRPNAGLLVRLVGVGIDLPVLGGRRRVHVLRLAARARDEAVSRSRPHLRRAGRRRSGQRRSEPGCDRVQGEEQEEEDMNTHRGRRHRVE